MVLKFFVLFSGFIALCAGYYYAPEQSQCRQNEVLACVDECPPERTCNNRKIKFSCIGPTKKCEYKCICKPGYNRNAIGDCITDKQCDQCKDPFEFFACGTACDNDCKTLATQNRTDCPIKNIICNEKCYCLDGYARNDKKECVPVDKCPKSEQCPCPNPNEEYVECKDTCPPKLCRSIVARYDCSVPPACKPGCACKAGFLRVDKDSPCIKICDCTEMKTSPNCAKKSTPTPTGY